jgi:anti-anti-sigma factor
VPRRDQRHTAPPLVVLRSETESGRVGLRLVGELDLNTVDLLEAALARTRGQAPPAVVDLSELRFLDLIGLRALLRAVGDDGAGVARLVGATGIVRRLIELGHTIAAPPEARAQPPPAVVPTTTFAAEPAEVSEPADFRMRSPSACRSIGQNEGLA